MATKRYATQTEVNRVEIEITGQAKEIAALVLAMQKQPHAVINQFSGSEDKEQKIKDTEVRIDR